MIYYRAGSESGVWRNRPVPLAKYTAAGTNRGYGGAAGPVTIGGQAGPARLPIVS